MEVYIRRGLEEKNQIAENTIRFIDRQLEDMADSLRSAELHLQDFRTSNRVLDITGEGNLLLEQIKTIQNEQSSMELKARYYAYLSDYLEQRKDFNTLVAPSVMGVDDPQLNALLSEISKAYIDREELKTTVREGSPGLEQLNIRIENLRSSLAEKVKSLIESNAIAQQELNSRLSRVDAEIKRLPVNERMLIGFERDFSLIDKMYTYLQEKRAEAAIARASNIPDNTRCWTMQLPKRFAHQTQRSTNYLIALLVGLAIPFIIMLLYDFFNDKIVDLKEISKRTRVPVIGTLGTTATKRSCPCWKSQVNPHGVVPRATNQPAVPDA